MVGDNIISIIHMEDNATATVGLHLSHISHDIVADSITVAAEFVVNTM